ncbi:MULTISPECIES: hypothetical protein [unclassified Microbacterium]|uniref:hypothetical protein n=1 Tax=unclassified Microbacterium TaxID=2609290 RepID=UPI00214B931D|nr:MULTISPECIES: hypothetical protein [unclassified Microbacterium]MCR2784533.1 hypothetical protein [Microbacterium sp. zg.B96]MDL5350546.1 hypothetical protein [Microbacterium sp. zg-YB36]WIM14656.1 hypothetical protein QNO11_08740 [Microbacterium sp. zg-B96]
MAETSIEHETTLWMVNDVPARMVYGGRRWRVSDTPTRLRESVWSAPLEEIRGLYGWRFQATDPAGESWVFDVYRAEDHWHVHRAYS